jgi:hypothetical protein
MAELNAVLQQILTRAVTLKTLHQAGQGQCHGPHFDASGDLLNCRGLMKEINAGAIPCTASHAIQPTVVSVILGEFSSWIPDDDTSSGDGNVCQWNINACLVLDERMHSNTCA